MAIFSTPKKWCQLSETQKNDIFVHFKPKKMARASLSKFSQVPPWVWLHVLAFADKTSIDLWSVQCQTNMVED